MVAAVESRDWHYVGLPGGTREWPLVRWTSYGRWSDDGRCVYASGPHMAGVGFDRVIYEAREARGLLEARHR